MYGLLQDDRFSAGLISSGSSDSIEHVLSQPILQYTGEVMGTPRLWRKWGGVGGAGGVWGGGGGGDMVATSIIQFFPRAFVIECYIYYAWYSS